MAALHRGTMAVGHKKAAKEGKNLSRSTKSEGRVKGRRRQVPAQRRAGLEQQKKQEKRCEQGQGGGESPDEELCRLDGAFDIEFEELEVLTEKVAEARRLADLARAALSRTRNTHRTLATSFDEAEADLNQGFKNIQHLVSCTAVATAALSCWDGKP